LKEFGYEYASFVTLFNNYNNQRVEVSERMYDIIEKTYFNQSETLEERISVLNRYSNKINNISDSGKEYLYIKYSRDFLSYHCEKRIRSLIAQIATAKRRIKEKIAGQLDIEIEEQNKEERKIRELEMIEYHNQKELRIKKRNETFSPNQKKIDEVMNKYRFLMDR
jgi:predicted AAA+ superfamily ATPase